MMRQASIRNQRNKGLRSRSLNNAIESHSEFSVLGRKSLLPHDQGIKENEEQVEKGEEDGESQHTMDDEEAIKEIPEDGIDELDNEQEDEQDEEAEDGDDAVNEEEKDEQVEEAEFLDDQDPEEDYSSPEDRSNGTEAWNNSRRRNYARNAGNHSTVTDLVALQNHINYNNNPTTSGSSAEKLEQQVSPINHAKLKGNLLAAGVVLDVRANRQTNEALIKSIG